MSSLKVDTEPVAVNTPSADDRTDLEIAQRDSPVADSVEKNIPDLSEAELSKIKEGHDLFMEYFKRTGQTDKLEEEEEVQLFEGSTHSFLVDFGETKDVPRLIIAVFVIIVQLILYIVTANDALSGLSGDDFTVPVKVQFGRNCNVVDNLVCAPEMANLGYTVLAACILAFFLMHDLIAGIRLMVMVPGIPAKLAGALIFGEAVLAAFIGTIFALSADEGYDAIANCIGVLFIHDVDEKAFEAVSALKFDKMMNKFWKKLTLPLPAVFISTFLVMVFSMSLAAIVRQDQFKNLESIYGTAYAKKYFGDDGEFNYDEAWGDIEEPDNYDPAEYWGDFIVNGYWGTTASPTRSPTKSPTMSPTNKPTPKPTAAGTVANGCIAGADEVTWTKVLIADCEKNTCLYADKTGAKKPCCTYDQEVDACPKVAAAAAASPGTAPAASPDTPKIANGCAAEATAADVAWDDDKLDNCEVNLCKYTEGGVDKNCCDQTTHESHSGSCPASP